MQLKILLTWDQNTCCLPGSIISNVLCHILLYCALCSYTVDIRIPHFLHKQWVTVCLPVWMWFITVTNRFNVLFLCYDVTRWYSLTDISTHQMLNPSQIVGDQLDHSLHNHGNYQTQIIPHHTVSNTSISYFLKPLDNILTIPNTPAASRTS
jgi:hypothetical protein